MENEKVPKYVFDKEYSTQWRREVQYLEEKGIAYTYAKKHYKYPIIRYKYTKTPELFLALAEFYNQVRIENFFKRIGETAKNVEDKMPLEKGYIEIKESELTESEKKLLSESKDDTE